MSNTNQRMEIMWGTRLLDEGFTSIPNIIIRNYRKLGIEHGEWGLVCTILTYKHDSRDPYPSEETIANDMQCSTRQIRKWISSLKDKGLVWVGRRRNSINKKWNNNVYNFKPLIDAALKIMGEDSLPNSNDDFEIEWENKPKTPAVPEVPMEPSVLQVPMGFAPQVPMGFAPQVPTKKKIKKENIKMDGRLGEHSSQDNAPDDPGIKKLSNEWQLFKDVCETHSINTVQTMDLYKVWRHHYMDASLPIVLSTLREILNDRITINRGKWTEQEYKNMTGLFHHRMKAWREMAVAYEDIDYNN